MHSVIIVDFIGIVLGVDQCGVWRSGVLLRKNVGLCCFALIRSHVLASNSFIVITLRLISVSFGGWKVPVN